MSLIHPDICYELLAHVFMYSKHKPNHAINTMRTPSAPKTGFVICRKINNAISLALQLVDPHLNVFKHTQENHIVDSCTNEND